MTVPIPLRTHKISVYATLLLSTNLEHICILNPFLLYSEPRAYLYSQPFSSLLRTCRISVYATLLFSTEPYFEPIEYLCSLILAYIYVSVPSALSKKRKSLNILFKFEKSTISDFIEECHSRRSLRHLSYLSLDQRTL